MEDYSSANYHNIGDSHQYLKHILSYVKENELLKKFTKKLYAVTPMLKLSESDCQKYALISHSAFKFFELRYETTYKVGLFSDHEDFDLIFISTDNQPFLVDSTTNYLHSNHVTILESISQVFYITRDTQGKITDVSNKPEEYMAEALLIYKIEKLTKDKELHKKLIVGLEYILKQVAIAVKDWRKMLDFLQNDIDVLTGKIDQEVIEFLIRLKEKYFVFLGACSYKINKTKYELEECSNLGIVKLNESLMNEALRVKLNEEKKEIFIGKLNDVSQIHRNVNYDYICVNYFDDKDNIVKSNVFVGLFTSILYYQTVTCIPIIRKKVQDTLTMVGLTSADHIGKEVISILEMLPRDELFDVSNDSLSKIAMEAYALAAQPGLKLFYTHCVTSNISKIILFVPADHVTYEIERRMKDFIKEKFGAIMTENYSQIRNTVIGYYHFIIDSKGQDIAALKPDVLENTLQNITCLWHEELSKLLKNAYSKDIARHKFNLYAFAFPSVYQNKFSPNDYTLRDIEFLDRIRAGKDILFDITEQTDCDNNTDLHLKIYTSKKLPISMIIPVIHNLGFTASDEYVYRVKLQNNLWILDFEIESNHFSNQQVLATKEKILETLDAIWQGLVKNDIFNELALFSDFSYREISIFRAIYKYMIQIGFIYAKDTSAKSLLQNSQIAKLLRDLFLVKFDPSLAHEQRNSVELEEKIHSLLNDVKDGLQDRILRKYLEIINAVLRTNYFITPTREYISLKINSSAITNMPLPRPFREIFVYSLNFEAIHLRSSKVARGGLRWSDRHDDYRTEILGLMKAQVTKNAVIIPMGSKGGFIVKNRDNLNAQTYKDAGIASYKNFLRGLLEITDNIVDGKIVHPRNVVRLDEDDPYLVVAADKGTASFSDIANSISAEFEFWLGDAFASGGSAGYDHKKMGITAKGAWVCVQRHFRELGIHCQKVPFTVIGIGDMSGDVFGNGLLMSNKMKLIAAFNHLHIFVDPNPDPEKSYAERKRLFLMPGSKWSDYNHELLSAGARVYQRSDKLLDLTPEIQIALQISQKQVTPDELIVAILKSNADLLWNGGIGTYVKAETENNVDVGDKANDNIRINGGELGCLVVGEGGNLGFTQLGRVEYASKGGKINTDFIDNSAGVDCSDHEVNIKIAFSDLLRKQTLSETKRNKILEEMELEVAELVLRDNRLQTQALSIMEMNGVSHLEDQRHFINILESNGKLNRGVEKLPSDKKIIQMQQDGIGLTRPELAVLLAYSKNDLYEQLLSTNLPDDPYLRQELEHYFPVLMQKQFLNEVRAHQLHKEIVAATVTNSIINRVANYYVHLTEEESGHKVCDIARAYVISRDIFDLQGIWNDIESLDDKIDYREQIEMFEETRRFVQRCSSWLLRNSSYVLNISSIIDKFKPMVLELCNIIEDLMTRDLIDAYNNKMNNMISAGVPKELARKIAMLRPMSSAYNIIEIALKRKSNIKDVAALYFEVGVLLNFDWLRISVDTLPIKSSWIKLQFKSFKYDLSDQHRKITSDILKYTQNNTALLEKWTNANKKQLEGYKAYMEKITSSNNIEFAMLDLALKKLSSLLIKGI